MRVRYGSVGPRQTRQRGMAVVVAMLVVAIVAVIAAGLVVRQSVGMRTLRGEVLQGQVQLAMDAALEHAALQVRRDAAEQITTVVGGRWALPIRLQQPLPVELQLFDMQARFNLRNLLLPGSVGLHERAVFVSLCTAQGDEQAQCARLADGIVHALQRRSSSAAQRLLPAFSLGLPTWALQQAGVSGRPMLQDQAVLLPTPSMVNINTAGEAVAAAALPWAEHARLQVMLAGRDRGQWLAHRGDVAQRLALDVGQVEAMRINIQSEWFLARGQVHAEDRTVDFQALLWRQYLAEGVRVQTVWTRVGA